MTHINEFQDPPEVAAARAADPAWVAEQYRKTEAAADAFARRRESIGLPLEQKNRF